MPWLAWYVPRVCNDAEVIKTNALLYTITVLESQYIILYDHDIHDTGICVSDTLLTIIEVPSPTHKYQVDAKRTILVQQVLTSFSCDAIAAK